MKKITIILCIAMIALGVLGLKKEAIIIILCIAMIVLGVLSLKKEERKKHTQLS